MITKKWAPAKQRNLKLNSMREEVYRLKDNYHAAAEQAEEFENKARVGIESGSSEDEATVEINMRQAFSLREKADHATGLYSIATADLEEYKKDYKSFIEDIVEEIQHVEESRIHFVKYTLEKFYRH